MSKEEFRNGSGDGNVEDRGTRITWQEEKNIDYGLLIRRKIEKDGGWDRYINESTIDTENTSILRTLANILFEEDIAIESARGVSEETLRTKREETTEGKKVEIYKGKLESIKQKQKQGLREWMEYLDPREDENNTSRNMEFTDWFRFFVIIRIIGLAEHIPEEENFKGRKCNVTMDLFPRLNKKALSLVSDWFQKKEYNLKDIQIGDKTISAEERNRDLEGAIITGDFKKLYAMALSETREDLLNK